MDKVDRLFNEAFNRPRDPRSPAYKMDARALINRAIETRREDIIDVFEQERVDIEISKIAAGY